MKKNLQRIVICFSFFIFWMGGKEAKAQWVTIPDAGFVAFLQNSFPSAMNGNQLDTTNMWVSNFPSNINCSAYSIHNFAGIQYFKLLSDFIYVNPNLFSGNVNVPELPSSVSYIKFYLPISGQVYFQHLSLPNLTYLDLSSTDVFFIPPLSLSLTYLGFHMANGNVGLITPLPPNLLYLKGTGSYTTTPALPNSLKSLDCSYMSNLASLPNLPSSLRNLNCTGCNLSSLPILPTSLDTLECAYNHLYQLPTLPNSLKKLHCNNNNIVSLPVIPHTCKQISANNNLLSSIGSLPDSIIYLNIQNNSNINCLPELKKISSLNFFGTGITCLPNYGNVSSSNPLLSSLPICQMYNPSGCNFFWNISGKVFDDTINNCFWDSLESPNQNIRVNLFESGNLIQQTLTNDYGEFIFQVDTGLYTYSIDTVNMPFIVTCPASQFNSSVITFADSLDVNMDFGLQCEPGFDVGLDAIVRDSGIFRPANFAKINIMAGDMSNKYGLHCASGISGMVTVIISGPSSYISASNGSLTPTVSGDTLTYSIADFGTVNFNSDFSIIVQTDTTAAIGSSICIHTIVTPTSGDSQPLNNSLQQCFIVIGSYDPNEKEVYPVNKIIGKYGRLTYTIHFQNTGTASAQHIYILDTLDAPIDGSSFELLAFSHQPQMQIKGNVVRFNFPNINLPDSVSNEPASHGYVQYRVKLKDSLALGTVISNTSYIYFDFNTPVQTNTVVDTLTDCNNLAAIDVINQTFCAGDTLKLNAALAYPAATDWYVDSIFISSNQNISVPNLTTGNHEIKLVAANAYCNTEVISNVEIHSLPLVDLGNDTANCLQYLIDAGAGFSSYQWSNGETTQTIIANATANYSVLVTDNNGCSNADDINIILNPLPIVQLGNDSATCNLPVTLETGVGFSSYQWSNGATTQTIIANATAHYFVVVTDSNGCSNTDTISIAINPLPSKPVITQNISLLTSSSSAGNQWLMNGNIIAGATNTTYTVAFTGWYNVQVTDSNGCSNVSDSIFMDLTGVNAIGNPHSDIHLIPNPATSSFEVSGLAFKVGDAVTVTDALGKIVQQIKIAQPTANVKLQTSNYKTGIYFVSIKTSKFSTVLKLVKE